jgi:integrase
MRSKGEGTIYKYIKRGKVYYKGRIDLGYKDGKPYRPEFWGKTQKEAKEKLVAAKKTLDEGKALLDPRVTVGRFLDWWVANVVLPDEERSPRTKRDYVDLVRLHIRPHLGKEILSSLSDKPIRAMLKQLQEKGLSPRRRQYVHAVLRIVLRDAQREGCVHRNVAKDITMKAGTMVEIRPYTFQEGEALLTAAEGHRLEALFMLATTTGMRQGEMLGLRWDALDIDSDQSSGTVTVRQTLLGGKRNERGLMEWTFGKPKTDRSRRQLWLPAVTRDALVEHRARQSDAEKGEYNLVFTREDGLPLTNSIVYKLFKEVQEKAGLRHQRFHDLRHAAASYWLGQGADMRTIMGFLGHSTIQMTANLYTHLRPEASQEHAEKMNAMFSKKKPAKEGAAT